MTNPAGLTPAQARQEQRDAEIVGEIVIPFVGAVLDVRHAISVFIARSIVSGASRDDAFNVLDEGIGAVIDDMTDQLRDAGLSDTAAHDWRKILRDPAKTAAWYAEHKRANPRRYPAKDIER